MHSGRLFYSRRASPLHATRAGVGALWIGSIAFASLLLYHPVVLIALLVAVLAAGAGAGVGPTLARSLRAGAVVWVPIVLINVLVSRDGLTVFARLGDLGPFGQGNLTLEAIVFGAVVALKVMLLMLVTALLSLAVDPDETLRIVRRLSFRSALTASLATRMIPVLGADAHRIAEAQRTRPQGDAPSGRMRLGLLRTVVTGSLDRALDVAATLELRGFAGARRAPRIQRPWSRHDVAFLCSALTVLALALLARLAPLARFDAYPEVRADTGAGAFVVSLAFAAAILLPFLDRRGIEP